MNPPLFFFLAPSSPSGRGWWLCLLTPPPTPSASGAAWSASLAVADTEVGSRGVEEADRSVGEPGADGCGVGLRLRTTLGGGLCQFHIHFVIFGLSRSPELLALPEPILPGSLLPAPLGQLLLAFRSVLFHLQAKKI